MAPRKKKIVEEVVELPKGKPQQEVTKEKVPKPFKIDQDKGTKFRYQFKSWAEYSKYKGEKS